MSRLSYQDALSYSLKLLSYRPRSKFHLQGLLKKQGCLACDIPRVMKRLEELNLINDASMAEQLAEDLLARKPSGRRRLAHTLRQKKIPEGIVERVISKIDDTEETERAFRLAESLREKWKGQPLIRQKKKVYDFLARRGFDYELCREVIDRLQ